MEEATRGQTRPRNQRIVRWTWLAGLTLSVLIWWVLGAVGGDRATIRLVRLGVEAWTVAGLVVWVGYRSGILGMIREASRFRITLVGLVIACLFYAQYGPSVARDTYPFVGWSMYTAATTSSTHVDFRMMADGQEIGPLPITEFAPTHSPRTFLSNLGHRARGAADGNSSDIHVIEQMTERIVNHQRLRAPQETSVDAVRIDECIVRSPNSPEPIECRELITVTLDSP